MQAIELVRTSKHVYVSPPPLLCFGVNNSFSLYKNRSCRTIQEEGINALEDEGINALESYYGMRLCFDS